MYNAHPNVRYVFINIKFPWPLYLVLQITIMVLHLVGLGVLNSASNSSLLVLRFMLTMSGGFNWGKSYHFVFL